MPTRMNVVFPDDVAEQIRDLVPEGKRTEFVVAATRRSLLRERQLRAIDEAFGAWADSGGPTDTEAVLQELEEGRSADREREDYLEAVRDGRR
jgi:Arc/MetJ-type ribon-helix-helix transcriptional regulator